MIAAVSERLTGICPGYFGVGEKLFNQGRIECERILQQPPQQRDRILLQVSEPFFLYLKRTLDTLALSFRYFTPSDITIHLQVLQSLLLQHHLSSSFISLTLHAIQVLHPVSFSTSSHIQNNFSSTEILEETRHSMYQSIIHTLKYILFGAMPNEKPTGVLATLRASTQSENAEDRAREIHTDLNLIIQSEQKELCFMAFQLLLDTKHVDLLLNVRLMC